MNKEQILDVIGQYLGWVDYPSDSIEQGTVWHLDSEKAPFGRILDKSEFDPFICANDAIVLSVLTETSITPLQTFDDTLKSFVMSVYEKARSK